MVVKKLCNQTRGKARKEKAIIPFYHMMRFAFKRVKSGLTPSSGHPSEEEIIQEMDATTSQGTKRKSPGLSIDVSSSHPTAGSDLTRTHHSENEGNSENMANEDVSTPVDDLEIDFSLVYALHTFVATREGQVAVVRNEPLILLDDTNCYWWLVKPLNTNVIGYIPAEIVETPYERLARVNRQKNAELSQVRVGDEAGGTMRVPAVQPRQHRPELDENGQPIPKGVSFNSEPQWDYFEPETDEDEMDEDVEYSEDDEDEESRQVETQQEEFSEESESEDEVSLQKLEQEEALNDQELLPSTDLKQGEEDAKRTDPISSAPSLPQTDSSSSLPSPTLESKAARRRSTPESLITTPIVDKDSRRRPLSEIIVAGAASSSPRTLAANRLEGLALKTQPPGLIERPSSAPPTRSSKSKPEKLTIQKVRMVLAPVAGNGSSTPEEGEKKDDAPSSPASAVNIRHSMEVPVDRASSASPAPSATLRFVSSNGVSMHADPDSNGQNPVQDGEASPVEPITVLRIYPGKCNIRSVAQFKTCVLTRSTTVSEFLQQSLVKFRVLKPSKGDSGFGSTFLTEDSEGKANMDELSHSAQTPKTPTPDKLPSVIKDWYITLESGGQRFQELNEDDRVLEVLEKAGQQMFQSPLLRMAMRTGTAEGDKAGTSSNAAPLTDKSASVSSSTGGSLNRDTASQHSSESGSGNNPKPLLQIQAPASLGQLKLKLNQRSYSPDNPQANAAPDLLRVVLYGSASNTSTDDSASSTEKKKRKGTLLKSDSRRQGPLSSARRKRKVMDASQPGSQRVRMVKTVRISPEMTVADVIRMSLMKFLPLVETVHSKDQPLAESTSMEPIQSRTLGRSTDYTLMLGNASLFQDPQTPKGRPSSEREVPLCEWEKIADLHCAQRSTFMLRRKDELSPALVRLLGERAKQKWVEMPREEQALGTSPIQLSSQPTKEKGKARDNIKEKLGEAQPKDASKISETKTVQETPRNPPHTTAPISTKPASSMPQRKSSKKSSNRTEPEAATSGNGKPKPISQDSAVSMTNAT